MVQVCPGTSTLHHITLRSSPRGEQPHRMRRAVLMALLFGLMFLPIFLEVAGASEPVEEKKSVSLLASRKTLDFGARPVGGQTPVVTLAIAHNGAKDVAISKVALAGDHAEDFTVVSSTCESLAPNGVCEIEARFAPKAAGPRKARLVVTSGGKVESLEIPLVGKGIDPSQLRRTRRTQARPYR